jgi:hypothetical protein
MIDSRCVGAGRWDKDGSQPKRTYGFDIVSGLAHLLSN